MLVESVRPTRPRDKVIEWVFVVTFYAAVGHPFLYDFLLPSRDACEAERVEMATWYAPDVARVAVACGPRGIPGV